jgi:hypothetical protein
MSQGVSELFDLSKTIPGTDHYMKTYVARYIAMGGEFPEKYIIDYMKTCSYPQMFGKRMFPGFGLTICNPEQTSRRESLKQAVGFE